MAQTTMQQEGSARAAAKARRRAQAAHGRKGAAPQGEAERKRVARTSEPASAAPPSAPVPAAALETASGSARAVARRRRAALAAAGRKADTSRDRTRNGAQAAPATARAPAAPEPAGHVEVRDEPGVAAGGGASPERGRTGGQARLKGRRVNTAKPTSRALAMSRRAARASGGKSASNSATSAAGIARQANPRMSSRELARSIREQRSKNGRTSSTKSAPCGRVRPKRRGAEDESPAGAQDAVWKVGASETGRGQTVTGTRVGRAAGVTGDEASTCRTVTGTEYLGADIFRQFCQSDPRPVPAKVGIGGTARGSRVTGSEVGRSRRVTGDEPGTCKSVTGTEYLSPDQQDAFCGTRPSPGPAKVSHAPTGGGLTVSGSLPGRSPKVTGDEHGAGVHTTGSQYTAPETGGERGGVPPKVGVSVTLSGGAVTGTRTGRSRRVTGDEPGSCKRVTGNEYADLNQYEAFCDTRPEPAPAKVGTFRTLGGQPVSGTRTGRSQKVTGDEPGTCKAVTGTPYGGAEDLQAFCDSSQERAAAARWRPVGGTPGADMTGIQPRINGVMTGAERGACEDVSGTPYVGKTDYGASCGALPGQEDFPQPLDGAPWQSFSVASPARQAFQARAQAGVTGTRYEQGQITGPFNQGAGKVTGTEEFRFDHRRPAVNLLEAEPAAETVPDGRAAPSRVTGEGQSAGLKITGDDWARNERVTGTEGTSAIRRNPTRPGGPVSAIPAPKRNTEVQQPVSLVTGSVGTYDSGALITYSGGARG